MRTDNPALAAQRAGEDGTELVMIAYLLGLASGLLWWVVALAGAAELWKIRKARR